MKPKFNAMDSIYPLELLMNVPQENKGVKEGRGEYRACDTREVKGLLSRKMTKEEPWIRAKHLA